MLLSGGVGMGAGGAELTVRGVGGIVWTSVR